jgi:hypothetical protein
VNVVFLCIGAAKAGTDWLHRHLSVHPECHLRAIKELHYFSSLERGRLDRELEKHTGFQTALMRRLERESRAPDAMQAQKLSDRADWMDVLGKGREDVPAYLDYLHSGAREGQVVADMTPAYALLPEDRLRRMGQMADDVRFLYLLRDPIQRLWSHVRMIAVRRDPEGRVTRQRCARILQRVISGQEDQIAQRSDYAGTLNRLALAVPGPQVLVEAFEDMVQGEGLQRLCRFLGIAPMAPDAEPVHAGQPLDMTRDQRRAAADWLAPQYDAAERALGRMPEGWTREG